MNLDDLTKDDKIRLHNDLTYFENKVREVTGIPDIYIKPIHSPFTLEGINNILLRVDNCLDQGNPVLDRKEIDGNIAD